jgi:hypothetical protein
MVEIFTAEKGRTAEQPKLLPGFYRRRLVAENGHACITNACVYPRKLAPQLGSQFIIKL